jgi:hypothetical protein
MLRIRLFLILWNAVMLSAERKGIARIRTGGIRFAGLHCYEARGIGKQEKTQSEFKVSHERI